MLRFTTGITVAFVLFEAMGWSPTFLGPVLFAVLITSLPVSPPIKAGLGLVSVMSIAALGTLLVSSLLRGIPVVLFGAIALLIFLAFVTMAHGRAKLPATLLLLCLATIPVIVMVAPAMASFLPLALMRAMAVAVLLVWCTHAFWPAVNPPVSAPIAPPVRSPIGTALVGTAVVMPVMLVYLLFGIADALPVLVTTVLLVTNFDPRQGAMQGIGMMLGNIIGGLVGLIAFILLAVVPSLATLTVITVLVSANFAICIDRGGPRAAIALLTCNSAFIIWSTAIANPSASSGVWLTRVLQFAIACLFAISMMSLVWGKKPTERR